MERIEQFVCDGKNFIYLDISDLRTNNAIMAVIEESKPIIETYEGRVLYTITNIKGVMFDTATKKICAEWMTHNKAYVKSGAIIGIDGIKQIMVNTILTLSKRKNVIFASTKEEAIEQLLKK